MGKKICYVFVNYPAPSEVFGEVEMEALSELGGVQVAVASLLSKHKKRKPAFNGMVKYNSALDIFIAVASLIANPLLLCKFIFFLFRVSKSPIEFFKSFVLGPSALSIAEFIDRKDFDIVHCFWGHYPSLVVYFLKCRKSPVRCSVFTGAYDLVGRYGVMEWGVNNADIVFTHSRVNVPEIRKFYNGPVSVHYRGVNCRLASDLVASDKSFNTLEFAYAGRLIKSKRPDLAIKLFIELSKKMPGSKLHIFGSGPEEKNLRKLACKSGLLSKVEFHGYVEQAVMLKMFSCIHFFLFPSAHLSERLPNVVKEAMLMGCVPVVTFTPGIDELVESGVSGIVSDFADLKRLVDSIEFLSAPSVYGGVSASAKERVLLKFDNQIIAREKIKDFFG